MENNIKEQINNNDNYNLVVSEILNLLKQFTDKKK